VVNPKSVIIFLSLFCLASASAFAQISSPTQLALEVRFYPNEAPAYQLVHPTLKRESWYARFPRVSNSAAAANSLPVTAVSINSQQAEDGVRVWVSVYLGKLHEEQKQVGSYVLREGESVTAKELADVGVVPFEIKLVRLSPSSGQPPQFQSKAPSIELVTIQPNFTTLPTVQLVVRNVSTKPVQALEVQTSQAGRRRNALMPQGKEGEALIPPGGTFELTAPLASPAVLGANGYSPQVLPDQTVTIATAVFGDGSYEGDRHNALAFLGFQKGRKSQLGRILKIISEAQEGTNDLAWLKAQVEHLNLEADQADIEDLSRQFPPGTMIEDPSVKSGTRPLNLEDIKTVIQLGMKVRDEVLKDITQFEIRSRHAEPGVFKPWLESSKARYQAWLSRL
jgi:hypothetical protein